MNVIRILLFSSILTAILPEYPTPQLPKMSILSLPYLHLSIPTDSSRPTLHSLHQTAISERRLSDYSQAESQNNHNQLEDYRPPGASPNEHENDSSGNQHEAHSNHNSHGDNHSHETHHGHNKLDDLTRLKEYEIFNIEPFLFESKEEFFKGSQKQQNVLEAYDPEDQKNQVWFPGNIYFGSQKEFSPTFETYEIYESVNLIEFKMMEVNELIKECVNNMIENNLLVEMRIVKEDCVGLNYQVLFQNYEEGMQKLRAVLVELLHLKFASWNQDFRAEKEYFFKTLDRFMTRDFYLPESLHVARKAAGYYIARSSWDEMVKRAKPEIEAFDELHKRLRHSRSEIHEMLESEAKIVRSRAQKIVWDNSQEEISDEKEDSEQLVELPFHGHSELSSSSSESESGSSSSSSSSSSSNSRSSSSNSSSSTESHSHEHHHHVHEQNYEKKEKEEDDKFGEKEEDENKEGEKTKEGSELKEPEDRKLRKHQKSKKKVKRKEKPKLTIKLFWDSVI